MDPYNGDIPSMNAPDKGVAILLCTYNSSTYLREQLDSFFAQTYENWSLWVSDDGSTDDTLSIIREYEGKGKSISIVNGLQKGASSNFLSILRKADIDADFYAWSDADDIWFPDKLKHAVASLAARGSDTPALYCARTEVVDEDGGFLYYSPLFTRAPCFRNALCQSIGGGNTMVFNRAAKTLMAAAVGPDALFHDWWAYMFVSGAGGTVIYDPVPRLCYRQHSTNLVGGNMHLRAQLARCRKFFGGGMRQWNKANVVLLEANSKSLSPESRQTLDAFRKAMEAENFWSRLKWLRRSGIFRQRRLHNIAIWLGAFCGAYP